MNLFEKANIIRFHRHRIAVFNDGTVKALGWRGEESQHKRFEVISKLGDFNGSSVLDLGCGYGDLKAYLDQSFSNFSYLGIDQMPEFVNKAKRRHRKKVNTHFLHADFSKVALPKMDFVIASGALSYHSEDTDFHTKMIRKFYTSANIALAFNMMNDNHFKGNELLVGHNFKKVLSFCKSISPDVKVFQDYFEGDFTIFMYHESN